MNFILVSAFAAVLKKSSAYDLSQAQGRLFFFCKIVHLLLFFTPKLLNILPTTGAGDQGWRSAEITRLPPMWPGFDAICGLSLLLVFSLAPGERFFSGYSGLCSFLPKKSCKDNLDKQRHSEAGSWRDRQD